MLERFENYPEMTSMERYRDLRDYALVFGFPHAIDLIEYLSHHLQPGDSLLDLGCGSGRSIVDAARSLFWHRVQCHALDIQLPFQRHRFVEYHEHLFNTTRFEPGSITMAWSVCGLGMYAEDEDHLFSDLVELNRILDDDEGTALLVVDPAIATDDYFEMRYLQLHSPQIRVQSPTIARRYFTCNIAQLLEEAGLMIDERIMPYGSRGMMIDDEITLQVVKV